jgi:cytochrome P450
MQASTLYWDPYDTDLDDEPYAAWKQLRDQAPVYRNDRYDFWALSRFVDVEASHKDPLTYSSARGTVLENMGDDMSALGMMIFMDPPAHTRLRALVSRALTPRRVAELQNRARSICAELLDPHVGSGRFDYVQQFATQLPSRVISSLVGVPAEDQEEQRRLVDAMFHIEPGVGTMNEAAATAGLALISYLHDLVEERTAEPRDDMVSDLVRAELADEDGQVRRLTADECTRFTLLLYSAGTETVAKLLGNAAVVLGAHPEQRADLVSHPDVIPNAIEELLRYEAPSPVQGRWTTRDVSLHGVDIPKDSKVLLLTGSAGRDTARTSASAPRSRVSKVASRSRRRCDASRIGGLTRTVWHECTRAQCGATGKSQSSSEPTRPATRKVRTCPSDSSAPTLTSR